jgi:hypothetical protein
MSFQQMAFRTTAKDNRVISGYYTVKTQVQKNVRNIETTLRTQQSSAPPAPLLIKGKTAITGGFEFQFKPVGGNTIAGYKVYKSLMSNVKNAGEFDFIPQPPNGQSVVNYQHITSGAYSFWLAAVNHDGKTGSLVPMAGAPEPLPVAGQPGTGSAGSGIGSGGGAAGRSKIALVL